PPPLGRRRSIMSRPGFIPTNHPHQVLARQREAERLALLPADQRQLAAELLDNHERQGSETPARSGHPTRTSGSSGVDDSVDDRETPPCVYVPLHAEFDFTFDAASSHHNAKCARHCTLDGFFIGGQKVSHEHGLVFSWRGERVWCNPPFSDLRVWVERAWDEDAEVACVLLP